MNTHFGTTSTMDVLLQLNVQAVILSLLAAAACCLPRGWITAKWRSILWILVFLRFVIPFSPQSALSPLNAWQSESLQHIPPAMAATSGELPTALHHIQSESHTDPLQDVMRRPDIEGTTADSLRLSMNDQGSWWSLPQIMTTVWLSGSGILLLYVVLLRLRLAVLLSRCTPIKDLNILDLARTTAHEAGLRVVPKLLWGPGGSSPGVVGWWRPVLLLPRDSTTLAASQLHVILLHEFRHVRSGDTLLMWLPKLVASVFWLNPFLWWAGRRWHDEREMACDTWVLERIGTHRKRRYLETLLVIAAESQQAPAFVFTASIVSSPTLLERRILAMKQFHPTSWTSILAGSLLTLVIGAIGLTDAVQAENDVSLSNTSATSSPRPGSQTDSALAAVTPSPTAEENVQQQKAIHPKVVFAQHVILWERKEILTEKQLQERLANLREKQPVTPNVEHSLGFMWKHSQGADNDDQANERANKALMKTLDLIGPQKWNSLSFLSRRGSAVVDHIKTADDLKVEADSKLTGQVTFHGKPVASAQVVILPLGEPANLNLRNGQLRDSDDEISYETDSEGKFEAAPSAIEYDPVLLYGEGKYRTIILHEEGYLVIDGPLAESGKTYELQPWQKITVDSSALSENERVEVYMKPSGSAEDFPGLVLAVLHRNENPVVLKAPVGSGRGFYMIVDDDSWSDSKFRHPIKVEEGDNSMIVLPSGIKE